MFRTVLLSIIRSFSVYTHCSGVCHTGCADSLRTGSERNCTTVLILFASCQQTCMTYTTAVCVHWKTPDDGQNNCPKHVEFYSKNKFEKLVHLVGFTKRIYHDARSPERQFITMHGHLNVKYKCKKTVFLIHRNMFRLSRSSIIWKMSDKQTEHKGREVSLCRVMNYNSIILKKRNNKSKINT